MAPTMLQSKQSEEPTLVRKRSRTASDSLDTWLCEPTTIESKEVQRPASSTSSFSSCTTQKDSKTLSLEVLVNKEGDEEEEEEEVLSGESVCVTPKAKKYRIPVVDVDLCPPAPKKARRLTVVCSRGRERKEEYGVCLHLECLLEFRCCSWRWKSFGNAVQMA